MVEKYTGIEPDKAREMIKNINHYSYAHRGIDRCAYLFDGYAVLSSNRLKLRNVDVRDDDLIHLDDIIARLNRLYDEGVKVVPILGYCYDPESEDGTGYIIMKRAKGAELYDDAIICRYQVWTQDQDDVYLKSNADAAEYIVRRTHDIAQIPQLHFDHFVSDILAILKDDILIDFQGRSNFFYDEREGFQFIDLDSHTDSYYGINDEAVSIDEWAAVGSFVPCHFAERTRAFASAALCNDAIEEIGEQRLNQLAADNLIIFDKCIKALKANDISDDVIEKTLKKIRVYGQ